MNQKKKRSRKRRIKKFTQKNIVKIFLLILLFTSLISLASYFIMNNKEKIIETKKEEISTVLTETKKEFTKKFEESYKDIEEFTDFKEKEPKDYFDDIIKSESKYDKFEEYTKELEKDYIEKTKSKKEIDENNDKVIKKVEEIKEEKKKEKLKEEIKTEKKEVPKKIDDKNIITSKDTYVHDKNKKPKIIIIIDDVSTTVQKEKILNIGYPITMAFLPPTKAHSNSAKIALDLPFYMIHFPMQASSAFKGEEENTLKIYDSYEKIEQRVKQLRQWYPNAIYTNNHTGSVFTENEEAMDKLFRALKKHNFIFVDSRTTAKSVVKKYANKYNMPYIVRNTFLDNERDFKSVQTQLKKAIEIAKKQGYAIAIGHPYDVTFKVLKESKHLLKDVEPVFLNKLPYL